jgi:hypothetical protein
MSTWKLKRELDRVRQQIVSVPYFGIDLIRQSLYDRRFPGNLVIHQICESIGNKYVIFLSFEPRGLSKSVFATCQHLRKSGYNVLFISNAELTASDLEGLHKHVWRVVQRPNFGYDFGGYRDGIRLLRLWNIAPDSLVILNDSIWFPIDADCRVLADLESNAADFQGAVKYSKPAQANNYFFESYFLFVRRHCFLSETFQEYWDNYKLSNIKYRAVHQGERGFSKAMYSAGHTHDYLFSRDLMVDLIENQSALFLRTCLEHGAYSDEYLASDSKSLLLAFQDNEMWKQSALAHIKKTIERRHFHASFPYASMALTNASFLKKNNSPLHLCARQKYVEAVQAGHLPFPTSADMWHEIQAASKTA